jgi:hypothetical protein
MIEVLRVMNKFQRIKGAKYSWFLRRERLMPPACTQAAQLAIYGLSVGPTPVFFSQHCFL